MTLLLALALAAAPPPPGSPAYQAAEAAYAAYDRGDPAAAAEAARRAVAGAPDHRDYHLLLVNALAAADRLNEAERAAAEVERRFGLDPALALRRAGLLAALGRRGEADRQLAPLVDHPGLAREARLMRADLALADGRPADALTALAPLDEPSHAVWARRGYALDGTGARADAFAAYDNAYHLALDRAERAAMARARIHALVASGDKHAAASLFRADHAAGALLPAASIDLAYLAAAVGEGALARQHFAAAEADGSLAGTALLDAAYNARATGERAAAARLFRAALAADAAGAIALEPQARLYATRDAQESAREVGGYVTIARAPTGLYDGAVLVPGAGAATYAGGELYWRPDVLGGNVDLLLRAFATLDAEPGNARGGDTLQGYAGIRWRPTLRYDLVFEATHLFPIGDAARSDWLLRAAYGLGQGGDVRLDRAGWPVWSAYAEIGQFLRNGQTLGLAEARYGWGWRLGHREGAAMLNPFIGLRASYDSSLADPFAIGIGPGLALRQGIGGGTHRAPSATLDLSLQYRFRIAGGRQGRGLQAGATLSY